MTPDKDLSAWMLKMRPAANFMDERHKELCFQEGDHHLEVDTAYSNAADGLEAAIAICSRLKSGQLITLAAHTEAVQAAVAKAVEAEREACARLAVRKDAPKWLNFEGTGIWRMGWKAAMKHKNSAIRARKGDAL